MLKRAETRIGEGGRIVIPVELRKALGLKVGDLVMMVVEDGELHIFTPDHGVDRAQAIMARYKRPGESIVDEFIAERRAEAARE